MKTIKVTLSLLILISLGSAQSIVGSKHDMGTGGVTGDNGQVCVYCHAPHKTGNDLLWNRTDPSSSYTNNPTLGTSAGADPGSGSKKCLSCHDGSIAVGSIINSPNGGWSPDYTGTGTWDSYLNDGKMDSTNAFMSTNLSTEHPIGITYAAAVGATDMKAIGDAATSLGLTVADLTTVECMSCHDPHETAAAFNPFLRKVNTNSGLCQSCHDK